MTVELLTALAVFSFVSAVTPGPNNFMVLAAAANYGMRGAAPVVAGVCCGFALMMTLIGLGLIRLFTAFPVTYTALKTASIAYLLYLSWKIATAVLPGGDGGGGRPVGFLQAVLFQWVNPKAWVMALTAMSAYRQPSDSIASVFVVTLVFGAITVPSVLAWALLGTQVRRFLTDARRMRIFNVSVAVLLVGSLYPIVFG